LHREGIATVKTRTIKIKVLVQTLAAKGIRHTDYPTEKLPSREALKGGGFGFEGGDGFDKAGNGEGVADAALAADEAQNAAFASELNGDAHEGGNAGAVDLGNAVEDDDDFLGAAFDDGFESVVKLI